MAITYGGSTITDYDVALAQAFYLYLPGNKAGAQAGAISFQYPPEVLVDGRSAEWHEGRTRAKEPIAVMSVINARTFVFRATWIVDAGSGWPASKIAKQLSSLRGYFMVSTNENASLIAKLKCWQIGGKDLVTCRLTHVDIKYSKTLVGANPTEAAKAAAAAATLAATASSVGGMAGIASIANIAAMSAATSANARAAAADTAFPLRTDVTITAKLWSQGGPRPVQMTGTDLNPRVPQDWY